MRPGAGSGHLAWLSQSQRSQGNRLVQYEQARPLFLSLLNSKGEAELSFPAGWGAAGSLLSSIGTRPHVLKCPVGSAVRGVSHLWAPHSPLFFWGGRLRGARYFWLKHLSTLAVSSVVGEGQGTKPWGRKPERGNAGESRKGCKYAYCPGH